MDVSGDALARWDNGDADDAEGVIGVATTWRGTGGRAGTATGEMAIGGLAETGVGSEAEAEVEAEAEPAVVERAGAEALD